MKVRLYVLIPLGARHASIAPFITAQAVLPGEIPSGYRLFEFDVDFPAGTFVDEVVVPISNVVPAREVP